MDNEKKNEDKGMTRRDFAKSLVVGGAVGQ